MRQREFNAEVVPLHRKYGGAVCPGGLDRLPFGCDHCRGSICRRTRRHLHPLRRRHRRAPDAQRRGNAKRRSGPAPSPGRTDARALNRRNFLPPGPAPENLGNGRARPFAGEAARRGRYCGLARKGGRGHEHHIPQFSAHPSRRNRRQRHERNRGSAACRPATPFPARI